MSTSRVYRLLRLITLLQGTKKYTAGDLAAELEVSRRTVFRDLNMLEMAHIPYYFGIWKYPTISRAFAGPYWPVADRPFHLWANKNTAPVAAAMVSHSKPRRQ